jgi:hypothetical protein
MTDLRPIQSLAPGGVRGELPRAAKSLRPVAAITQLLASVDWSTVDGEPGPEIAQLLGEAEEMATEAAEGDITEAQFVAAIESLTSTVKA